MTIKFKYTGDGGYLPGIPARDLTDEDWDALTPEQRKDVQANAKHANKDDMQAASVFEEAKPAKKGD